MKTIIMRVETHLGGALVNDSDADGNETLVITTYSHTSGTNVAGGSLSSNSNSGTAGSGSVTGLYGVLTLEADGSYTYVANSDIATLDSGLTLSLIHISEPTRLR